MFNRLILIKSVLTSFVLFVASSLFIPIYSFPCGPEVCLRLFANKVSLAEVLFGQLQENLGFLQGGEYHNHLLVFKPQDITPILICDLIASFFIGTAIIVALSKTKRLSKKGQHTR